jgi:hypothetical protein
MKWSGMKKNGNFTPYSIIKYPNNSMYDDFYSLPFDPTPFV